MRLQEWCVDAERIAIELRGQYWDLQQGLVYDEKRIGELENASGRLAEEFIGVFNAPVDLVDDCIGSIASAKTFKDSLRLTELRKTGIVSKMHRFKGNPVSWQSWRQFVSSASDSARKDVFDEFIALSSRISPIVKSRFDAALNVYEAHGTDPLQVYARSHRMSVDKLRGVIVELRDGIRDKLKSEMDVWSTSVFGRPHKYYDDLYVLRNRIYDNMRIPNIDPIKKVNETLRGLGLDPAGIKLDAEDRPGKFASPFMSAIQVPSDVRVSYKPENPINDLWSIYHEYGHAVHYKSIDASLPYWTRNVISEGLAETFSIFFDTLLEDSAFLVELGFSSEVADEIVRRTRFKNLYSAAFYCANSLFKIDSWKKGVEFKELSSLYAAHLKDCMGIDVPGEYWLLHHILPDSLMYVPSYMLAEMRVSELHERFRNEFGVRWWHEKSVGKELLSFMRPGSDSVLADFSHISPNTMIAKLNK